MGQMADWVVLFNFIGSFLVGSVPVVATIFVDYFSSLFPA